MRRLLVYLLLTGLLASLIFPAPSSAQTEPPENEDLVSFARLGAGELNLRGPFDAAHLEFSLPATWELTDGLALRLHLATFFAGQASADQSEATRQFGGSLQVVVNGVTAQTILLDQQGERTIEVPLPLAALAATTNDARQRVSLLLDTDEQCGLEQYTSVVVRTSSHLVLPHRMIAPPTDLALLPRPIVQRTFSPDTATIVVADQPTAGELQAALTIAAGFGRMTDSAVQLGLLPMSQVDAAIRDAHHLILVGRSETLPFFNRGELPELDEPQPVVDDGVIRMLVSPWNPERVLLVASGTSDAAVIKAAQAISTGAVRGGTQPNLALVMAVQRQTSATPLGVDRTFADLGYETQQMYGQGAQYAAYRFELPAGQIITGEAYLDLTFVHTALLDYDQSGLTITVNDELIASVRLDDTSTRLHSTRIALPGSALRAGSNNLTIRGDLLPRAVCTDPRGNGLWLAIRPESNLHLPLSPAPEQTAAIVDLKHYPRPLTISPNLERLAFVLAPDDPQSWSIATRLAFDLGRQMHGTLVDLLAVYSDQISEQVQQTHDLLIVGRASTLPILNDLKPSLLAPFESRSDLAIEPSDPVQYRRTRGESVGYVQLVAAPWNKERIIVAVLGSTHQGLAWAEAALTTPRLRSRLSGSLVMVYNEQITSSDTPPPPVAVDQRNSQPETESVAAPQPDRAIFWAAGTSIVLLLTIIGAIGMRWRRRTRRA